MITRGEYLEAKKIIEQYREQLIIQLEESNDLLVSYDTPLNKLDVGIRLYHVLKRAGCHTLSDILSYPIVKIRKEKNFGKKTEIELLKLRARYVNA